MARRADRGSSARSPRSAFARGVLRTVRGSLKRFVALATITALGVTMLVGLRAACTDLRESADAFFDAQRLFDVRVQSTLGLTDDDVAALAALDGVEVAEGGWSETVYTTVGSSSEKVDVRALSEDGMNEPLVLEGHLPTRDDQVAVTRRFLEDSGLCLGDTVTFHGADDGEDGATEVFERKEYTIIAVVLDPMDVNAGEGTMSFRSGGGAPYSFFVLPDCVSDPDTYTVAYLTVEGAAAPLCYSDEYERTVDGVLRRVEDARAARERARGEGLRADAAAQVDDAEAEANAQLEDAAAQIADGQAELDDGRAQLDAAAGELASSGAQVSEGLAQIADQLGCSEDQIPATIASRRAQLEDGAAQLAAARDQAETSAAVMATLAGDAWPADEWGRLAGATTAAEAQSAASALQPRIDAFVSEGTSAIDQIVAILDALGDVETSWNELPAETQQQIEAILAQLNPELQGAIRQILSLDRTQVTAQLTALRAQLAQVSSLVPGMVEIVTQEEQLASARTGLDQASAAYDQLAAAQGQISSGWDEVASGRAELDSGQAELDDARATYESERADALQQIADARAEVDDIPDATWYVQDRSSLSSYASVDSDASSIEAIGTVIPVVFFVVAVLISLTTMTRMVEEERGLIGVYKALGYGRGRILSKYALYALAACAVGGVVGNVLGFVVLPAIIFTIFSTMYALPGFVFGFDALWACGATALFAVGIVGATLMACARDLRETPASLMLPKAPKAGARIFLEHVGFVWRRMGFLNKVAARNLLRYKRRFLMTVFGVAGCVALLVTGFGIRDTVISLSPRQYGESGVVRYDLMAVTTADDLGSVESDLAANGEVADLAAMYVDSVTATFGDAKESVQLYVVPEGTDLGGYVDLRDDAGRAIDLDEAGVAVTKGLEQVTGLAPGDGLHLQDSTLAEGDARVGAVALSYLGDAVYMSEDAYEEAFGAGLEPNALLAHLTGSADEQVAFAERLTEDGRLLSVTATQKLVNDFSGAFTLINTVVYVVIVLAAALAFTVVFTLSNTNISERARELATIKVLGFQAGEVHRYINKETLILTGIGIVVGLPMGYALARSLTWILKMPSLYFDVVVDPLTYVVSAALAFVFTLVVNLITNRSLDRIDMVGALKSAE
ncbi:FtsX-like permease family protein [Thermophilibacter sp.]